MVGTGSENPPPRAGDEWAMVNVPGIEGVNHTVAEVTIDGVVRFTSGSIIKAKVLIERSDRWQLVRHSDLRSSPSAVGCRL